MLWFQTGSVGFAILQDLQYKILQKIAHIIDLEILYQHLISNTAFKHSMLTCFPVFLSVFAFSIYTGISNNLSVNAGFNLFGLHKPIKRQRVVCNKTS
jgi:hypothetical protein